MEIFLTSGICLRLLQPASITQRPLTVLTSSLPENPLIPDLEHAGVKPRLSPDLPEVTVVLAEATSSSHRTLMVVRLSSNFLPSAVLIRQTVGQESREDGFSVVPIFADDGQVFPCSTSVTVSLIL